MVLGVVEGQRWTLHAFAVSYDSGTTHYLYFSIEKGNGPSWYDVDGPALNLPVPTDIYEGFQWPAPDTIAAAVADQLPPGVAGRDKMLKRARRHTLAARKTPIPVCVRHDDPVFSAQVEADPFLREARRQGMRIITLTRGSL
tara:strand:+ start:2045 stop:2470 length:426 start_codon:yes stop_codon:yes gene_type:complete